MRELHVGGEPDVAIAALFDLLNEMGESEAVLAQAGVKVASHFDARKCLKSANAATSSKLYGLVVDRIVTRWSEQEERVGPHRSDWEMMVYCLLSSATLAEAMDRLVRFQEMISVRGGKIDFVPVGSSIELRLNSRSRVPTRLSVAVETIALANLYGLFCWLTKKTLPLKELAFGFSERFGRFALPGMLPVPYRFGAPHTAFRIPSRCLELPILRTSREVEAIFSQRLLRAGVTADQDDVSSEVKRLISHGLLTSQSIVSLTGIADAMGVSVATLRRRLAARDLSYRQIKESCRRDIAEHILRYEDVTIEDVADRLAFCDSDAFRVAFKDWTGLSPSEYRRISRGGREAVPLRH